MSKTVFLLPLLIGAFVATIIGASQLAKVEKRVTGKVRLAPTLFLGLLAGVAYLFYLDDAMVSPRTDETVRRLFHLSDDVVLVRHGRGGGASCYTHSTYTRRSVQFSPRQFESYIASIGDARVWRPVLPPHYVAEKSDVRFSADALA